jgi:hypothetical protein
MKMAALIMISAFFGAAGVAATDMAQHSKIRDYLLSRIDSQLQLAEVQLEHIVAQTAKIAQQYENDLIRKNVLSKAEHQLRAAEVAHERLQLDREEILLTGREPLQSLSAPLVNGRDFVLERLALDISLMKEHILLADGDSTRERYLVEEGLLSAREARPQLEFTLSLEQHLSVLQQQRELRLRFLKGEITAAQAEREGMLTEARSQLKQKKHSFQIAQERFDRSTELHQQGMIQEDEVYRAQLHLTEQEIELQSLLSTIECAVATT